MRASEHGGNVPSSVGEWFCAPHEDTEVWQNGGHATREAAIEEGRELYGSETAFFVGEGVEVELSPPDADGVIDHVCCNLCDAVPSDLVDGYLADVSNEERAGLTQAIEKAFAAWLTETGNWPDFCAIGSVERIDPRPGTGATSGPEQPGAAPG